MKQQGVFFSAIKLTVCALFLTVGLHAHSSNEQSDSPHQVDSNNIGGYFSFGILGDFALGGYSTKDVDRDPRLAYQVEVGSRFFAIPISFSSDQSVQIVGLKPRAQFLIPLVEDLFLAGPGLGFVYNYWYARPNSAGGRVTTHISEFGAQLSLQVIVRPTSMIFIAITPAAYDINFWRVGGHKRNPSGVEHFSTESSRTGFVYSTGLAVGFSF